MALACLVALCWPCSLNGRAVAGSSSFGSPGAVVPIGPRSSVADDFEDLLDDLADILNGALTTATAHSLPLSSQEKQTLDAQLDNAEALIDQVFNPVVAPNLTPVDAGNISLLFTPSTLADYAEQCIDLAQDAKDELVLHGDLFDHALVGTKLKTIRYLTSRSSPHNYRTKAGIN
jgi:hypothetical protein